MAALDDALAALAQQPQPVSEMQLDWTWVRDVVAALVAAGADVSAVGADKLTTPGGGAAGDVLTLDPGPAWRPPPGLSGVWDTGVAEVRHVRLTGDDANDGRTPSTAKRTVAAAVMALPEQNPYAGNRHHAGHVVVGPGEYVETATPIELNRAIRISGVAATASSAAGSPGATRVKLADGRNTHLFAPSADFTDYAHHVILEDLTLDGNNAGQTATDIDVVRVRKGGFSCQFSRVNIANGARHGLVLVDNAITVYCYDVTTADNGLDGIHLDLTGTQNTCNLGIFGYQADNNGRSALHVRSGSDGDGNAVLVMGMKTEAWEGRSTHPQAVLLSPVGGANAPAVAVVGLSTWRSPANTAVATAAVHEVAGPGPTVPVTIVASPDSGYPAGYSSAKTGATSGANRILGIFSTQPAPAPRAVTAPGDYVGAVVEALRAGAAPMRLRVRNDPSERSFGVESDIDPAVNTDNLDMRWALRADNSIRRNLKLNNVTSGKYDDHPDRGPEWQLGGTSLFNDPTLAVGDVAAVARTLVIGGYGARWNLADGRGVIALKNAATVPASNPSGGGILYAEAGALKWRGSSGTVTTIAPA